MVTTIRALTLITIGALIFSIGINYFTIPNGLSEGGIIGITLITHYLTGWSTGFINLVLNTIFIIIGYKYIGRTAIFYTLYSIVSSSMFLTLTEGIGQPDTSDPLLGAIFAGLLVGVGLGIIFRSGGTSGGTTIVARMLNQYLGWSIGSSMLILDLLVVAGSVFIIGITNAMYTVVVVYVGAKAIHFIAEGLDVKLAVLIISDFNHLIMNKIMNEMSRGITVLEGHGGYTGANKEVLYIVINKVEIVELKAIINKIDKDAYVTFHEVNEMLGRGYKMKVNK